MNICQLPILAPSVDYLLTVDPTGGLTLTVRPDGLVVCSHCPNLHVRLLTDASPHALREYARAILNLAYAVEQSR